MHKIHFHHKEPYRVFLSLLPTAQTFEETEQKNLQIKMNIPKEQLFTYVVSVYITVQLPQEIERIAKKYYFYSDPTDLERIIEYTNWLLRDCPFMKKWFQHRSLFSYLYKRISDHFEKHSSTSLYIQFETFVLFQFKIFHHQLIDIVGFAIDEMKREEEYQAFVQKLRSYVRKSTPKRSTLHIVQGDPFQFYSEDGIKLSRTYLRNEMKRAPLYLFGLDETEWNIAPVIALLPKQLYIYGVDEIDGKMMTLRSIFEERATFTSEKSFPFLIQK